jgi:23S rRNA (cytidine1920-2'-O)/16S rRNA (cytidine1409-2'-O)-methyltransferase
MERLDKVLLIRGYAPSRSAGKRMIKEGRVSVNGEICRKTAYLTREDDTVEVFEEPISFVSRGGLKLQYALTEYDIDLSGAVCLDVGASTGGFTDCMLQNGASRVYAVDVGRNQLSDALLNDERVVSLEKTDIRKTDETHIPEKVDFVAVDVSFISLKYVLPYIVNFMKSNADVVALIKPQFEVGRESVAKYKGVITDPNLHKMAIGKVVAFMGRDMKAQVHAVLQSPVTGGSGNKEFLMWFNI